MPGSRRFTMCTYSYGWYNEFVPTYVYSILVAYPHYRVRVFTPDTLTNCIREALSIVRTHFPNSFDILEDFRLGTVNDHSPHCRWLIPETYFEDSDYAYVGDVDFIIVREKPGLLEGRLDHLDFLGYPYSNVTRKPPLHQRLSGLHFFKVRDYFERMAGVIEEWRTRDFTPLDDEELLYTMVKREIGVPACTLPRYRPHHGFHLGLFRAQKTHVKMHEWKTYDRSIIFDPVLRQVACGSLAHESIDALARI